MRAALISVVLLLPVQAAGDEPELLPPPRPVAPPTVEVVIPYAVYRPDPRAVWQMFAPDGRGIFRPAVSLEPYPHYKANGMPYYHLPTRTAQ
jgi:hypothetical protein